LETGVWLATSPKKPEETYFTDGAIHLPVPMPFAITEEARMIIMTKAESETEPASRTGTPLQGTLANAKAHCLNTLTNPAPNEAGWVCVYTGVEELVETTVTGIVNLGGSSGLSRWGGAIEFLAGLTEPRIHLQGTWAVIGL
jgi:hypothetical protein